MGCATIDFTDIGDLARTRFVDVSGIGDQPTHLEPEISSEYCFEGIVGKSAALQKSPGTSRDRCAYGFHGATAR